MMNNLVIDLTHGGVKIATSLAKKGKSVLAYDIYNTLRGVGGEEIVLDDKIIDSARVCIDRMIEG